MTTDVSTQRALQGQQPGGGGGEPGQRGTEVGEHLPHPLLEPGVEPARGRRRTGRGWQSGRAGQGVWHEAVWLVAAAQAAQVSARHQVRPLRSRVRAGSTGPAQPR